jgi:hypothetical protein
VIIIPKIRYHHDADGITTAYLASYGIKNAKLEGWDGKFGDTTGLKSGDWMVDMRPMQNMEGLNVIDHHLPHREDRKYNLISDEVPASLIAFNKYKEDIPKSEWWKVAIGVMGDGQPELIPPEVFNQCPQLLTRVKTSSYQSYGKWKISYYPTYKLLSSYVNSFLRKRDFENALNLIQYSQQPSNILHSVKAQMAKLDVRKEFENIIKTCDSYDFADISVFIFQSDYRMTGYIASAMQGSLDGKTVMAINRKDGSGSLRGELAYYFRDKLDSLDYLLIDGHPGFCGVTVTSNPDNLIEDLVKLL